MLQLRYFAVPRLGPCCSVGQRTSHRRTLTAEWRARARRSSTGRWARRAPVVLAEVCCAVKRRPRRVARLAVARLAGLESATGCLEATGEVTRMVPDLGFGPSADRRPQLPARRRRPDRGHSPPHHQQRGPPVQGLRDQDPVRPRHLAIRIASRPTASLWTPPLPAARRKGSSWTSSAASARRR